MADVLPSDWIEYKEKNRLLSTSGGGSGSSTASSRRRRGGGVTGVWKPPPPFFMFAYYYQPSSRVDLSPFMSTVTLSQVAGVLKRLGGHLEHVIFFRRHEKIGDQVFDVIEKFAVKVTRISFVQCNIDYAFNWLEHPSLINKRIEFVECFGDTFTVRKIPLVKFTDWQEDMMSIIQSQPPNSTFVTSMHKLTTIYNEATELGYKEAYEAAAQLSSTQFHRDSTTTAPPMRSTPSHVRFAPRASETNSTTSNIRFSAEERPPKRRRKKK